MDDEPVGTGGYRFDSPEEKEAIKQQRAALLSWLKSMGSNMFFEGINLTKISLPVGLFEPRSFLERLPLNWEYLGLLLAAAETSSPVDRMVVQAGGGHQALQPNLGRNVPGKV
jgi:hypothetical protein